MINNHQSAQKHASLATDIFSAQKERHPPYYFNSKFAVIDPIECGDLTAVNELAARVMHK